MFGCLEKECSLQQILAYFLKVNQPFGRMQRGLTTINPTAFRLGIHRNNIQARIKLGIKFGLTQAYLL